MAQQQKRKRLLRREDQRKARELAKQCLAETNGNEHAAEELFKKRAPEVGIDPQIIILALQVFHQLLKWWNARKEARKARKAERMSSSGPQSDGDFDDDDEDICSCDVSDDDLGFED